ncbi:MAG: purine-cytosine permease family protein, partial [Nocardioidaceae bacterium]
IDVSYEDDPRVLADAAVDDYANHVVPLSGRMGKGSLTMAWYGVASAIFYVVTGAAVAVGFGTKQALIGLVLTIVVYSLVNQVISSQAIETGLSVAMFSRSMFGLAGASLATLIFAATAIYYFVFEGSIIAVAFQYEFGGDLRIWMAAVCVAGLLLIMRGVAQWLDKFNGILLPFYLAGMVAAIIWAIADHGYSSAWWNLPAAPAVNDLPGWLGAFLAYMGIWVLMMFTMDFARLGRPEDRGYHRWVTFGPLFYTLAFGFSAFIGVFLSTTVPLPAGDFGEAGAAIAIVAQMGVLGVILIFITQARINTANLYLASSNLEAFVARVFRVRLPRTVWAVVAAGICWVLMIWNAVLDNILKALAYQGVFITAWVTMALVHIAYVRATRTKVEFRPLRIPLVNWGGMVAWMAAVTIGIVLIEKDGVDANLVALAPLITVVVAAVLYGASLMVVRPATRARGADPAAEVDDAWAARIRCTSCDKSYVAVEMDRALASPHDPICAACS